MYVLNGLHFRARCRSKYGVVSEVLLAVTLAPIGIPEVPLIQHPSPFELLVLLATRRGVLWAAHGRRVLISQCPAQFALGVFVTLPAHTQPYTEAATWNHSPLAAMMILAKTLAVTVLPCVGCHSLHCARRNRVACGGCCLCAWCVRQKRRPGSSQKKRSNSVPETR